MPLDRLEAAGDPQLRRILVYARGRRDPFTVAEAAAELAVHRNVARARLDRLVEAGFLEVAFERPRGRRGPGAGRPPKVYRVAPELVAVEFPDRRLAELVALLVANLPARGRAEVLREVGGEFGRRLATVAGLKPARKLGSGAERVADALASLGFQAKVVSVDGDHVELSSPTCPLRPVVVGCHEARDLDRGMWAALVERGVQGVSADEVACETRGCHRNDVACRIFLSLGSSPVSHSF